MIGMVVASCSDNNDMPGEEGGQSSAFEADYIGKAVGNFTAEEWYPGGQLGTTDNVTAGCYEDEAPAVNQQGLLSEFNLGETFFERNFNSSTAPLTDLDLHRCAAHASTATRATVTANDRRATSRSLATVTCWPSTILLMD